MVDVHLRRCVVNNLSILRLYFTAAETKPAHVWWERLVPQTLEGFLLRQAKGHGIEQALLHRVFGGFLKNQELIMDTGESPPPRLPSCLELIGEEVNLQSFLMANQEYLRKVRIIFLRGEEVRYKVTTDS